MYLESLHNPFLLCFNFYMIFLPLRHCLCLKILFLYLCFIENLQVSVLIFSVWLFWKFFFLFLVLLLVGIHFNTFYAVSTSFLSLKKLKLFVFLICVFCPGVQYQTVYQGLIIKLPFSDFELDSRFWFHFFFCIFCKNTYMY